MHREAKCLTGTMLLPTDGTSITHSKQERIGAKAGQAPCKASAAASERQFSSRITSYNYKVWGITNPPFCVFEMNIYSQIVVGT